MTTIEKVLNPAYKTGTGKKGAWVLMQCMASTGEIFTIFGPAAEGDEVDLTFNPTYKNWSGVKVEPKARPAAPAPTPPLGNGSQLNRIEQMVKELHDQLLNDKVIDDDNIPF